MAKVSKYGQWKYPGEDTIIPSGDITMQGVPYPVLGIDNLGNAKMMQPGGNYTFPGTAVYEIPMMVYGGRLPKAQTNSATPTFGGNKPEFLRQVGPTKENLKQVSNTSKYKTIDLSAPRTGESVEPGNLSQDQQPNSPIGSLIEFVEPTGIMSWDDANEAYANWKNSGNQNPTLDQALSIFSAVPALGKFGKVKYAAPIINDVMKPAYKLFPWQQALNLWEMQSESQPQYKAYGGDISVPSLKRIKIKSLPKAQMKGLVKRDSLLGLNPEQKQEYEKQYLVYREQGELPHDANKRALNDVNYFGSGPIYNFQSFMPNADSGVRIASGKRYPYEHIDFSTYNPWQQAMSDPDFVRRYNKQSPEMQESMKSQIANTQSADTYFNNLDDVKAWEKNWYTKRATLPQFTDIANKRLGAIESVNMQPWGDTGEYISENPGSSGVYKHDEKSVNIPSESFGNPSIIAHERSHWFDYNFPQDDNIYLLGQYNGLPEYNFNDPILNNIIPSDYKLPYGQITPSTITARFLGEDAVPKGSLPPASDEIISIKLPFKNQKKVGSSKDIIDYYYSPTEVRSRTNEWRMNMGIDPTKNYTNEEIQEIIDRDVKSGNSKNLDLYKVVRGRGDLLKQIHDSYVSNDTPNEDELPKAQAGGFTEEEILANRNRAFQDIIVDDEMFDEGDFELYLNQAQTGGELPDDYQDFLNYSETAPENRRPDSEWQYGNPRQYDHYGMWDALGKPKTFEEALQKNPHWQPDPYDGMYHGFSTNPDTGVWLKSHIPGESHPGDTGWMEYKDFMLSNDRNWGGKNQNLVYDPDLQRMRYIERKQDGGGIMNMMQQVGYKPKPQEPSQVFQKVTDMFNGKYPIEQKEPGVFEQLQTMIGTPKPTLSISEQFNQVINAVNKPKSEPIKFKIPEDYYTRLMEQENGVNRGLKEDKFYPYPSEEGGNDTIGYGHKLTDDDVKAGRYSKGLTKDEAIALMRNDVEEHLNRTLEQYETKFGKGSFDKLHPDLKVLALDFVYNGLPINEYPNFFGAANQYSTTKDATVKKQAYEKMLKNYIRNVKKDGVLVPLGERNKYTRSVLDNLK